MLISKATWNANYGVDPDVHEINNPESATFQITDTKLCVPVVTLQKKKQPLRTSKISV